ncbi:hypothetical protein JEX45_26300, partial [Escherichia coli]|nr:hypothetical protein [Escherichia coli]
MASVTIHCPRCQS